MKGELTRVDNDMHDPEMWVDLYGDFLYRFALSRVKEKRDILYCGCQAYIFSI